MAVPVLVSPGHPSLAPLPLPCRDLKRVLVFEGATPREAGTAAEEMVLDVRDGESQLRRIQLLRFDPIGELAGISASVPGTLEPLRHETRHAELRIEASYGALEIRGSIARRDGSLTPIGAPRSALVFDLYQLEVVLRALPLARDYAAALELYWPERNATVTAELRVEGVERVGAGGGLEEEAWIVGARFADVEASYRVGTASRELLRQTQRLADGTRVDFAR